MELEYSQVLEHPAEKVWRTLLDPGVLSRLIPGIQKFELLGPDKYAVEAKLGVPTVKGLYSGLVEIFDKQEPRSYRLRGEGKGAPGWARGEVLMVLSPVDGGTRVNAKAHAVIGGPIAGVGQRMMEGVAKGMAREFFQSLDRELQGQREKATPFKFGFRVFLVLVRDLFARLFRSRSVT